MSNGDEERYEMSQDERYLFDLNGFLVVRGVLSEEDVAEANRAIDAHQDEMKERSSTELRNAKKGTPMYGSGPGRKDLGGVLEWPSGQSKVFKSILAHPKLRPYFHGLLGKGYRMDHMPFVITQGKGAEGFHLHGGTIDCSSGAYNPGLSYTYAQDGSMVNALLGCNVMLRDHNAGDGGFCVVPGSHKSNMKMPDKMIHGLEYEEFIRQPVTKAGDVVLFSEGTVHGAMAWTADHERRACLYRFAPAIFGYGRSYLGAENSDFAQGGNGRWPASMYEGLDDAQRAVLEPPYANRLDRPNIEDDGSVIITTRNDKKKDFDRTVFGTKYF
jgi:ectoine hydroxylase-related dioxygenase (phytanoyl-CoA dioxygenase family)